MTTYTIQNQNSGEVVERHVSATQAAHIVLTDDGNSYEVRLDKDSEPVNGSHYYMLWATPFGRNSKLTSTSIAAFAKSEDEAWQQIAEEVCKKASGWDSTLDVYTDDAFDQMMAEID